MLWPPKQAAAAGPTSLYFVRAFGFGMCDHRLNLWLFHSIWQSTSSNTASSVELHVRVHDQYYAQIWWDQCKQLFVFLCKWQAAAGNIINMLWQLMENGLEELKLLQTVLVLLTTNTVVHDEVLSKVQEQFYKLFVYILYTLIFFIYSWTQSLAGVHVTKICFSESSPSHY